jgi:PAS domain S-box-containing protein
MPASTSSRESAREAASWAARRPGRSALWVSVAFLSGIVLLLAITAITSARMNELRALSAQRGLVRAQLLDGKDLFSALQDAESSQRAYLLTGDPAELAGYEAAVAAVQRHRESLARGGSDRNMPQIELAGLSPLIDAKLAALEEIIQARQRGDADGALRLARSGRGTPLMDEVRSRIDADVARIERLQDARVAGLGGQVRQASIALRSGLAVAVAVLAVAFLWLRREGQQRDRLLAAVQREHERVEQLVAERTAQLSRSLDDLRSSEAFIRAIGDNLPDGALYSLVLDDTGQPSFQYVSAGVERINGLTPQALIADASLFYGQVVEEDRAGLLAERQRADRAGHVFRHEARIRRPDGELRWCLFTAAVRQGADGRLHWDGIELDITEQRLAARELRVSEERLRLATEVSNVGLWEWIPQSQQIYFSPITKRQLGLEGVDSFDSVDSWFLLLHPDDRAETLRRIHAASHAPWTPYENEYRVRHRDGSYRWFRARGAMLLDDRGQPLRLLGVIDDVTTLREGQQERERLLEQQLAARAEADAAHARVLQVIESVSDAFMAVDRQWAFTVINRKAAQTFAQPTTGLVGKALWSHLPDNLAIACGPAFRRAMEERKFAFLEVHDDVSQRWYETRVHPSEEGIAVFFLDISERKATEAALRASEQQLHALLALSRRDQERERIRIARQIHDELGQQLTGVKMDLRWLERKLSEPGTAPALNALLDRTVAASELNDQIITTVQRIAAELRPTALDHLGLVSALRQRAREFGQRSGLRCTVTVVGAEPQPAPNVANELFYIVQEALTNVARHAKATQVEVTIGRQGDEFVLDIRDDGQGIEPARIEGRHSLGLLGMRERALQCGGSLLVQRAQPLGTMVSVRVPVAAPLELTA